MDKFGDEEGDKQAEIERKRAEQQKKDRETFLKNNENPLLKNDITNCDIFRTLLFHFKTDNYIPIEGAAAFVSNLLKRPHITKEDEEADTRFYNSLVRIMKGFSFDGKTLNEKKFCELMRSFEVTNENEFTDEQQYDMFLERLFYRIKHKKVESIQISDFKDLIERAGFKFEEGEFENLIKWYFRNKETITLDEFKLFATGQCVKLSDK